MRVEHIHTATAGKKIGACVPVLFGTVMAMGARVDSVDLLTVGTLQIESLVDSLGVRPHVDPKIPGEPTRHILCCAPGRPNMEPTALVTQVSHGKMGGTPGSPRGLPKWETRGGLH